MFFMVGGLLWNNVAKAICRAPQACIDCHEIVGYGDTGCFSETFPTEEEVFAVAEGTCEVGGFTLGPDMSESRFIHRTAKLPDGRVLLTGGAKAIWSITETVDMYDPVTNTISPVASMSIKRWSHAAITLDDGRVLVCGGRTGLSDAFPPTHPFYGELLKSAEIYDPATDIWTATGDLNIARRSHVPIKLNDGRILIIGGGDRVSTASQIAIATCEIYDPATGMFSIVGDMTVPRTAAMATKLDDGRVLIVGGSTFLSTRYPTDIAEIFDPADNSFTGIGNTVTPHLAQAITKLRDGKVLIAGGYFNPNHTATATVTADAEIYDPDKGTFTATDPMVKQRIDIGGQLLLDGTVLIAGGASTHPEACFPTIFNSSSEIYDPQTGTWKLAGIMADGRDEFSGLMLDNGQAFISGGFTRDPSSRLLKTVELYTPGLEAQANGLELVMEDLFNEAFLNGDETNDGNPARNNLKGSIQNIRGKIVAGKYQKAFDRTIEELLERMDGCGTAPDADDLIVDCDEQKRVRAIVQVLVNSLNDLVQPNLPPGVTAMATPTSGVEPLDVQFTAMASDPDGIVVSYFWRFGDNLNSSVPNPLHIYECDGVYTATVRVTDDDGATAEDSVEITVTSAGGPLTYDCDVHAMAPRAV
jgi:hypothetical protein